MKCKVCGYEFSDTKSACPMCGTEVPAAGEVLNNANSWSSRVIPTPESERRVGGSWSSPDVSEGYVSVPESAPEKQPERFYTFQAKNDEFQKLLDKEFERLRKIQEETNYVLPKDRVPEKQPEEQDFSVLPWLSESAAAEPAEEAPAAEPDFSPIVFDDEKTDAQDIIFKPDNDAFERMLMEDTQDSDTLPKPETANLDAEPMAPIVKGGEDFDINMIEYSIRQIEEEEAAAQKESLERRKKLEAMAAARDAYFKSLDEDEASRSGRGFGFRKDKKASVNVQMTESGVPEIEIPVETPVVITPVAADKKTYAFVPLDDYAKSGDGAKIAAVLTAVPAADDSGDVNVKLEDLIGSKEDRSEHTAQFNKDEFREAQKRFEEEHFGLPAEDEVPEEPSVGETPEEHRELSFEESLSLIFGDSKADTEELPAEPETAAINEIMTDAAADAVAADEDIIKKTEEVAAVSDDVLRFIETPSPEIDAQKPAEPAIEEIPAAAAEQADDDADEEITFESLLAENPLPAEETKAAAPETDVQQAAATETEAPAVQTADVQPAQPEADAQPEEAAAEAESVLVEHKDGADLYYDPKKGEYYLAVSADSDKSKVYMEAKSEEVDDQEFTIRLEDEKDEEKAALEEDTTIQPDSKTSRKLDSIFRKEEDEEDEDDGEEDDSGRGFGFFRFLLTVIVIIALLQGIVLGVGKLFPTKPFAQTLLSIGESVQDAVDEWTGNIIDKIFK